MARYFKNSENIFLSLLWLQRTMPLKIWLNTNTGSLGWHLHRVGHYSFDTFIAVSSGKNSYSKQILLRDPKGQKCRNVWPFLKASVLFTKWCIVSMHCILHFWNSTESMQFKANLVPNRFWCIAKDFNCCWKFEIKKLCPLLPCMKIIK